MKEQLIQEVQRQMLPYLNNAQLKQLQGVLEGALSGIELSHSAGMIESEKVDTVACFINAKRIEGCSEKTLSYYRQTIASMLSGIEKEPQEIVTEDLRKYLTEYQASRKSSKVTIDNIRRILSSYFSWLEDEDYIVKSPVRRIHKVKTAKVIKETYTDEALEIMRDNCCNVRDLAMIDLLASSGMRVGEMVVLNRDDINFNERECVVFGKGSKERIVYFDARTKIHLQNYLESRTDTCSALFVSLTSPHDRLQIGGVERRLRELGKRFGKLKIIMTVVLLKVQMSIRLRKARRRLLILMRSSVILTDFTQLLRTSLTTMRPALPKELRSQEKQCLSALIARLHTLFIRL